MDYEKKYNEALERAKKLHGTVAAGRDFLAEIFPELAESEDEKELVLTWEDMVRIDNILGDMKDEYSKKMPEGMTNEKFYREVLKRFKEERKED